MKHSFRSLFRLLTLLALGAAAASSFAQRASQVERADYIVAVVNNELVTQVEVDQHMAQLRAELARSGQPVPAEVQLRKQVVAGLIDERVQITFARESGMKVDEPELDRAVANIASMNKMTLEQMRERLRAEGIDYARFRANLRDQILSERSREREVQGRIRVTDLEVDNLLAEQRSQRQAQSQVNLAQIFVSVPEGADSTTLGQRRARIEAAQDRLKAGIPFEQVVRELSEDPNRDRGGELGMRPPSRLPDLFVDAIQSLPVGGVTPEPLRSGAGFHLLKLVARQGADGMVVQTRARHILLRSSERVSSEAAQRRLSEFREAVVSGKRKFEDLARDFSEDGTAPRGGDLGWTSPGSFVPEFEKAMDALALEGISEPVVSRFGVHLIQVMERREVAQDLKQAREQARSMLREKKFDEAYQQWLAELRDRAYIEMRDPPL